MQKAIYTHFHKSQNREFSGFFLEKRRIFEVNPDMKNPEISSKIDTVEEVKTNLLVLKEGLENQKVAKLKAKIDGKQILFSRERLKDQLQTERVKEIIEKNIQKFSPDQLLMSEEIFPGVLKKMFLHEDGLIDFKGNREAEALLGLGDLLPLSQTYICVWDARTGKYEIGVRGIKNTSMGTRPAYINVETGKYIEILDNYKLLPVPANELSKATKDTKTLKSNLQEGEAIFDDTHKKEKGGLINAAADVLKNDEAKKNWMLKVGEIQATFLKGSTKENLKNIGDGVLGELKAEISLHEGGYNSFNRGKAGDSQGEQIDFSQMTLGEIKRRNNLPKGDENRIYAVGRYQVTPAPLREAMKDRGLSNNTKCTPEVQEEIFQYLIFKKRPVLGAYLRGTSNDIDGAMKELSMEFASVPKSDGKGRHDAVGGNKAKGGISRYEKIKNILRKTREKIVKKSQKSSEKTKKGPYKMDTNYPFESKESSEISEKMVNEAKRFLGTKYVWGGTDLKTGIDCSGFTQALLKRYGVKNMSRTAYAQSKKGKEVSRNNLKKGDLLFFLTDKKRGIPVTHVSMYIGNGKMIHAASKKSGVKIDNLNTYLSKGRREFVTAKRYI